jgi:hypothetical protein
MGRRYTALFEYMSILVPARNYKHYITHKKESPNQVALALHCFDVMLMSIRSFNKQFILG